MYLNGEDHRLLLTASYTCDISSVMDVNLSPVHFFSHGSTAMLGEQSDSADYWKECGDAARRNGIEHVVIMVREGHLILPRLL